MQDCVVVTGTARLGQDPDLRALQSGTSVCKLRVAWNNSRKDGQTGEWSDVPCWFDITVWGKQGEACAKFLSKGSQIVFTGRIEQRQWEDKETGKTRYAHEIVAQQVQFVGGKGDGNGGGGGRAGAGDFAPAQTSGDFGVPGGGAAPVPATDDSDIPFMWEGPPSWHAMKAHTRG